MGRRVSKTCRWIFPLLLVAAAGPAAASPAQPAGLRTVDGVVAELLDKVVSRLQPRFQFAGLAWPPREISLVALKDARRLELWARNDEEWFFIRDYRIKGMSGTAGPKLKEGDRQVPEGLYDIEWLNPNSAFHLSLKINYPNESDLRQARLEGRSDVGNNIFIHGKDVSRGCLAMGDNAVEELFVLAGLLGKENVTVLISPLDYRSVPVREAAAEQPAWVVERNRRIAANLKTFQPRRRDP